MIATPFKFDNSIINSKKLYKLESKILIKIQNLRNNLPKHVEVKIDTAQSQPPDPTYVPSLSPYSGAWTNRESQHLLRRTTFGFTVNETDDIVDRGMASAIDFILRDLALSEPPLNPDYPNDPLVSIGSPWMYAGFEFTSEEQLGEIFGYRQNSILSWKMGKMLENNMSIREKMTLFWHNHLPIADTEDPDMTYRYISLLETSSLGNFKQLIKDITIDPAMLRYLNGNQNTDTAPNENYARELLELFTIGKGALGGPGDYSTFTEQDVESLARVFTGWVIQRPEFSQPGEPNGQYLDFRHDKSDKVLSHRFGNAVISNNGELEYSDAIDIIFLQEEVSKFFCRNLYRWFIYYEIDENVELNIIEPLAVILRENNFEVRPVLEALLSSSHFYNDAIHGAMIKNPYDYMFGLLTQFNIQNPDNLALRYRYWIILFFLGKFSDMEYFSVPSVAGWKAYYQQPAYYQIWINSVSLALRKLVVDAMLFTGINADTDDDGVDDTNLVPTIDVISFMEEVSDPSKVNTLLTEFGEYLHTKALTETQKDQLKEILIPGLPDFEWTDEYNAWKTNPNDPVRTALIRQKLQGLLRTMMSMPEYLLS